ncbi:cytochrome P450 [Nonomuraea sp. NPDC049649]|uniref:cytochrome P450 n=1 Tax=Nonomuraea sp. NPDC049649 TaxID=3155776 RepID=UPI003412B055
MSDLTLTTERERPFDPPDTYAELRERGPVHRMRYADGHEGWLVTGYAAARTVLDDPRFSNRPELSHPPFAARARLAEEVRRERFAVPPGFFLRTDPPEHTRYRRLLAGQFTVRRMKQLEARILEITEERLDLMEAAGRPADLVDAFALPIPSLVICELLGVPYEERAAFQEDTKIMVSLGVEAEEALAAIGRVLTYLQGLIGRKREHPADDLLSGLITGGELTGDELTGVAFLLLIAGHETTANMLGLGTYALLADPAQLAALREDPSLIDNAVEELLRHLSIVHVGPVRSALEDVEIEGHLIRKGEAVTLHLPVINRDLSRFPGGDRLDITRPASGHLAFGHGVHQCLGQQLARSEMRVGFASLLRRLPGLRLAVPADEVPLRTDMAIYGVHRLPVTW